MIMYMAGFLGVTIYLCGVMIDLGMMETAQMKLQNAADAASGGGVLAYEDGSTLLVGALADAYLNGYAAGINGVSITVSNPPTVGPYQNNTSAFQVIFNQTYKTRFIPGTFTLTATSTSLEAPTPCVYLLSQYSTAISLNAINETVLGDCPFYVGLSYYFNGGSSSIGNQFFLHGGATGSSGLVLPLPLHGAPMGDPLLYVPTPAFQACTYTAVSITAATVLNPGTYCGGLSINTPATVTLNPGLYIIAGNLTINGPTLNGAGITFFMTTGGGYGYGVASVTNVNTVLSAPTVGSLQGILFFSDRNMPPGSLELSMANWNPNSTVDGILYMPGQQFKASNIPLKAKNYNGLVADYMNINNTGWVASNNYSSLANGNPFKPIGGGLVE